MKDITSKINAEASSKHAGKMGTTKRSELHGAAAKQQVQLVRSNKTSAIGATQATQSHEKMSGNSKAMKGKG